MHCKNQHLMIISFFCSVAYFTDFPLFESDFFEILENDVRKYNGLGEVYLTGDFNARTSNKGFVENINLDRFIDRRLRRLIILCG